MKTTKSLFLAFASLGLFACSNEDVITEQGADNGQTQSMFVRLEGLSDGSRGIGGSETGQDGKTVGLSNITVLFTDGNKVVQVEKLSSTDDKWDELTTTGYIFHRITTKATQVCIVGNAEGKSYAASLKEKETVSNVKNLLSNLSEEQTFTNVTLFGEDTQLAPSDATDPDGNELLEAEVTLNPLVSRIEIGNIGCEDLGSGTHKFSKMELQSIGLMDYNNNVALGGGTTGLVAMTLGESGNLLEPGSTPVEGKWIFGETTDSENGEYTDYKWAWDKFATGAVLDQSADRYNPTYGEPAATEGKFVYHFNPAKINDDMMNVKLVTKAYIKNDQQQEVLFPYGSVVTARFQKKVSDNPEAWEPLVKFEAGKIYTLDYVFKEENVGPWDPNETTCVKINVNVAKWDVVALKPVFN